MCLYSWWRWAMPFSPFLRGCAPGRTSSARSRKLKSATTALPGKSSVRRIISIACRTTPPPRNWRSASASNSFTRRRSSTSWVTSRTGLRLAPLQRQGLQVLAEGPAQIVAAQGEFHRRFQEAELVAGVVARSLETIGVDRAAAQQVAQGVGELDFAAAARVDCL